MHPWIQLKNATPLYFITPVLLCIALLPQAQAVSPAPDGCYPGFTTAEGCDALKFLTTGVGNTGLGWRSLFSNSSGNFNTGVGAGTLVLNTADSNTAVGVAALLLNTTGTQNVAVGTAAFVHNDSGSGNNAVGAFALYNNTDGFTNNAVGNSALLDNIHGHDNTAIGDLALSNNDSTGSGLGNDNTAAGSGALFMNTDGDSNTAVGFHALLSNTTGLKNTATGARALPNNTDGSTNTAVGFGALLNNTTGLNNIAIGNLAGMSLTTGDNNIDIGAIGLADESNTIRIGVPVVATACVIGGIYGRTTVDAGIPVLIDDTGQLGTVSSSRRFKKDIQPMDKASEEILALKPVTFHYNSGGGGMRQFGLIAEDVAEVSPDLVVRDKEGNPYTVRYDQVNAMLLNEFLKEHRKVQELEANATRQQKQIDALTAVVQKVSAQLEVSKPAPQTVLNN